MMRRPVLALLCFPFVVLAGCEDVVPLPVEPTVVLEDAAPVGVALRIDGPGSLAVGDTVRYHAVVVRDDGSIVPADSVFWSSPQRLLVAVRPGGLVNGVASGTFGLHARSAGRTASRSGLIVHPAPQPWSASGTGTALVDVPARVERVRVVAENPRASSRNFVLWCGAPGDRGGKLVDLRLGTGSSARLVRYDAEHSARRYYGESLQPCLQFDVFRGADVSWTLTEVLPLGSL